MKIFWGVIVGALVLTGIGLLRGSGESTTTIPSSRDERIILPSKQNEANEVTVMVAPQPILPTDRTLAFAITLNTHTVELDIDLVKASSLIAHASGAIAPLSWDGDPPGGHHRSGVLTFPQVDPLPSRLLLQIKGIDGGAARTFTWDIE